jgi:lysophospholipase L1-like esterase
MRRARTIVAGAAALLAIAAAARLARRVLRDRLWRLNNPYFVAAVREQSRRSEQIAGAVACFGDSQMVGFAVSGLGAPAENFSVSGDTVEGLISRLPAYRLGAASRLVIQIGINNWPHDRFAAIGRKYRRLLALVPAETPVVVLSIMPVGRRAAQFFGAHGLNAALVAANAEIRAACEARPDCVFIDLTPTLADARGDLRARYDSGDGLHVSAAAYAVWREALLAAWRETVSIAEDDPR